jgi:hypothetical protein
MLRGAPPFEGQMSLSFSGQGNYLSDWLSGTLDDHFMVSGMSVASKPWLDSFAASDRNGEANPTQSLGGPDHIR